MKLHYELLRDDALALAVHDLETSARHRPMRLGLRWGLPVLAFALLSLSLRSAYGVAAGVLFAATYSIRIPGIMRRSCERQADKLLAQEQGKRALGPHQLSVEPAGFTLEAPLGRARWAAADVARVVDSAMHVFIHLRSGALIAVPKRTLSDSQLSALHDALGSAGAAA